MPVSNEMQAFIETLCAAEDAGPALAGSAHGARLLELKDARAAARDAERLETREAPGSDEAMSLRAEARRHWEAIADGAPELLAVSRDLEVLCWLCEARLRIDGLCGLRDAFALLEACVERYWDRGLHPQADPADPAERIAAFVALNGEEQPGALIRPLRMAELAESSDGGSISLWHAQTPAHKALFESAILRAPHGALREHYRAAAEILASVERIAGFLRPKIGADAVPTSYLRGVIEDIMSELVAKVPTVAESPADVEPGTAPGQDLPSPQGAPAAASPQALNNREEALKSLLRAADYFERTEPHSILAQSLRDLVRRARLPLLELLEELIPNADSRREFLIRSGIRSDA